MHPAVASGGARCILGPCDDSTCIDVTYSFCALSLPPWRKQKRAPAAESEKWPSSEMQSEYLRESSCAAPKQTKSAKKSTCKPNNAWGHFLLRTHTLDIGAAFYLLCCTAVYWASSGSNICAEASGSALASHEESARRRRRRSPLQNSLFLSVYVRASHS